MMFDLRMVTVYYQPDKQSDYVKLRTNEQDLDTLTRVLAFNRLDFRVEWEPRPFEYLNEEVKTQNPDSAKEGE